MAVLSPSKSDLRADLKKRRDVAVASKTCSDVRDAADALATRVLRHLPATTVVAAYLPISSEIETLPLIDALCDAGHVVALPHVRSGIDTPRFLVWKPGDPLIDGPFGLRQPFEHAKAIRPDVMLTPLLGFDLALNRIGYGAGHYDRAFAAHPDATRIGLAWAIQQCEHIPVDAWDIALHAVATEQDWITS